jgi:hypothetical protein
MEIAYYLNGVASHIAFLPEEKLASIPTLELTCFNVHPFSLP